MSEGTQSRADRILSYHAPYGTWPKPWTDDQIFDHSLSYLVKISEVGDRLGMQAMHRMLARGLRDGELTPAAVELLAEMHEAIARGDPLDVATITRRPPHRAPNAARDASIFNAVQWEADRYGYWLDNHHRWAGRFRRLDAKWSRFKLSGKGGVYADVAARFGLSPKTVENIHQAMLRVALEQMARKDPPVSG